MKYIFNFVNYLSSQQDMTTVLHQDVFQTIISELDTETIGSIYASNREHFSWLAPLLAVQRQMHTDLIKDIHCLMTKYRKKFVNYKTREGEFQYMMYYTYFKSIKLPEGFQAPDSPTELLNSVMVHCNIDYLQNVKDVLSKKLKTIKKSRSFNGVGTLDKCEIVDNYII